MSSLFDFLTDIAINPKRQIALAQQPNALINELELSEADNALVKSHSSNKIAAFFADEFTPLAVICNDPNPEDPFPDPDPDPESSSKFKE